MSPKPVTLAGHVNPSRVVKIGNRVAVYWPDDKTFYPGTISEFLKNGKVKVQYDDEEAESLLLHQQVWEYIADETIYPRALPRPSSTPHPTPTGPAQVTQETQVAQSSTPAAPSRLRKNKPRTATSKPGRKKSTSPKRKAAKQPIRPNTKRAKICQSASSPAQPDGNLNQNPPSIAVQPLSGPNNPTMAAETELATRQAAASLGHPAPVLNNNRSCLRSSTLKSPVSSQKQMAKPGKTCAKNGKGKMTRQKKTATKPKNVTRKNSNKVTVSPVVQDTLPPAPSKVQKQPVQTSVRTLNPVQPATSTPILAPHPSSGPQPQLARPIVSGVPLCGTGNASPTEVVPPSQIAVDDELSGRVKLEHHLKEWADQVNKKMVKEAVRSLLASYRQQLNKHSTRVAEIGEQVTKLSEDVQDIDKRCKKLRADMDFLESEALSTPAVKRMLDSAQGHHKAQIQKTFETYSGEMKTHISETVELHVSIFEKTITDQVSKKSDQLYGKLFAEVWKNIKKD